MNDNALLQEFIQLAWAILVNSTPVDTRNLLNNTTYEIGDGYAVIHIAAPSKYGDYSQYVNYNDQHTPKLRKNYHYVERSMVQAARIIASTHGGQVYELS